MGALKSKKCSRGHSLSGDNLYIRKNGGRECRKCSLNRSAKKYAEKKYEKSVDRKKTGK